MLPYIDAPFAYLGSQIGVGGDELKLVFSFILSYPLAGLLKRIPDARPDYKNLYIIGVGLFYLVGLFDLWSGLWTVMLSSVAAYGIAYFMRGSPYMPWVGFVFLMSHMSVSQLERQFENNPASVDITGAQMVLVIKLSAFCWNVADGALPEDQLSDFQKDRALKQLPGFLDYFGYVFFFPCLLVGPACDFAEYRRWIDLSMFEVPSHVDPAKKPPTRKKRKIPRSGTPAMWKAASGTFWMLAFLFLSGRYYPQVLTGPTYMTHGFLHRVFILHMVSLTARAKYYAAWSLTEGACILSGLGYNGVDPVTGKVSWDRLQHIYPWGVEAAQNTRAYLENWNIKTNTWLRNYMYLRVTPRGKKPGFRASLATFVTSAFWHGFYPGYYLTFVLASFIQTCAKNCRRSFRPFFMDPLTNQPTPYKKYYDFASWLTTQLAFTFTTAPFLVLGFADSITVWARVYFYCIVGVAGFMAFFASPAKPALKRQIDARAARAGASHIRKNVSADNLPVLGLSADPQKDIDEAVAEIRAEVELLQKAENKKYD